MIITGTLSYQEPITDTSVIFLRQAFTPIAPKRYVDDYDLELSVKDREEFKGLAQGIQLTVTGDIDYSRPTYVTRFKVASWQVA